MATSSSMGLNSNPFYKEDDDVDDFEFLSHPRQGKSGYLLGDNSTDLDWEQRRLQLLEEKRQIEQNTLQGMKNSLGLVHESEQVGMATAEELVRQREQLENVEDKVDEINSTMRISQKHLTSMKSLFGGIKSYFTRSNSTTMIPVKTASDNTLEHSSALQETVEKVRANSLAEAQDHHPALRLRGIDTTGFGSPEEDKTTDSTYSGFSQKIEQQIDSNIDQMNLGLGRLKSLAIGLGSEIEEQNMMLDRLTGKVEKADETVECQNRQMKRILKK